MRDRIVRLIGVFLVAGLAVAGCSSDDGGGPPPDQLEGAVRSGDTGLAGATVRLYEAGDAAPRLLGEATTNADGSFAIPLPAFDDDGIYVVRASLGGGIELAAVLGDSLPDFVTVNELTTVAAAFAFAQFFEGADIRGDALALSIAAGMNANLVDVETGQPSSVMLASPNGDESNSLRSTRSLANLLAACVEDPETGCPPVFALTTPPGSIEIDDTLRAMVSLARNPALNVIALYQQSQVVEPYQPPLQSPPDAWTLAVKVNQTGSAAYPFGGTANTVFDDRGYAWINNNTVQGTSVSGMSVIVLKPDGSPADGADGTPTSPVLGGGVLGAGFGVARNPVDATIWVGNFGWGGVNPGPEGTGTGSVSHYTADGEAISGDMGYDGGTDRVQAIVADRDGNIWSANFGNDRLVVFPGGDYDNPVSASVPCHPFGLAIAADGTVWLTTIGGGLHNEPDSRCLPSSTVSHWRLDGDRLERLSLTEVGDQLKGIDIDFDGYVWVASGGDDYVYRLDPDGNIVGQYRGGGMNAPWDVRIDDAGNVWVANFGAMVVRPDETIYDNAALTVLAGPRSPSGLAVGEAISPPSGYTLPSAGAPVLLSDGTPLSETGDGGQPAYTPLMRAVSAVPDRAGNVWVSNNWKPNFASDIIDDPGGDGMVIFVGLAAPTEPGRTQ